MMASMTVCPSFDRSNWLLAISVCDAREIRPSTRPVCILVSSLTKSCSPDQHEASNEKGMVLTAQGGSLNGCMRSPPN